MNFHLQSQFQRFLYQTLFVISQVKDIKHINRNFHPAQLGPNKHGLVTYIQVNVYIGNMFSWLNGG